MCHGSVATFAPVSWFCVNPHTMTTWMILEDDIFLTIVCGRSTAEPCGLKDFFRDEGGDDCIIHDDLYTCEVRHPGCIGYFERYGTDPTGLTTDIIVWLYPGTKNLMNQSLTPNE